MRQADSPATGRITTLLARGEARLACQRAFAAQLAVFNDSLR